MYHIARECNCNLKIAGSAVGEEAKEETTTKPPGKYNVNFIVQ